MRAMGTDALVDVLQEQLRCANEREQQGREREARLLVMLEAEQQARRALEQRLLPALKPPLPRYPRPVALLIVLALALLVLAITRWAS